MQRLSTIFLSILSFLTLQGMAQTTSISGPPQRIVSTNLASDEILLELVPPQEKRILALSTLVDDPKYSNAVEAARNVPHRFTGNLDLLMHLKPASGEPPLIHRAPRAPTSPRWKARRGWPPGSTRPLRCGSSVQARRFRCGSSAGSCRSCGSGSG